jgi:hypothetical protein
VIWVIIRVILDVHPVLLSCVPIAQVVVPRVVAADVKMVESPHPLHCWVAIGLKHARLERWQITVFLEPADVEMNHLLSLCREFPPGFVGDAGGMRELIVSELGPQRAWRILARSIHLHR